MPSISDLPASAQAPTPPHNHEAESALLGALMFSAALFEQLPALAPEHFYWPEHQRIFAAMQSVVKAGGVADAVTLKQRFAADNAMQEIGGGGYLLRLLECAAPMTYQAVAYAELIRDLAQRRALLALGNRAVMLAMQPPEGEAASDLVATLRRDLDAIADTTHSDAVSLGDAAASFVARLDDPRMAALPSGYSVLDRRLGGGFFRGDLIVIAGRPSMGKTTFANNIARNMAANGFKIGVISEEMHAEMLAMRALSAKSYEAETTAFERVAYTALRNGAPGIDRGKLSGFAAQLAGLPLLIDDRPGLNVQQIEMSARAMRRRLGGLDALVVDYLQILGRPLARGRNDAAVIGEMTTALKVLARTLNIAVIVLSQLSRNVEQRDDKRPTLADLRESGAIEQDTDVVIGLFREEYYLERAQPSEQKGDAKVTEWSARMAQVKHLIEALTLKQRNGPVGTDTLKALLEHDKILNARA